MIRYFSIVVLMVIVSCTEVNNQVSPPNIIWIVSDDLGTDLGCYGNKAVQTPNLDTFARNAERYTNFFTVTPVCSPSRSSLITGMYPTSIASHQHRTFQKEALSSGIQSVTSYFKDAGYYVSNANAKFTGNGKMDYNFDTHFDSLFDHFDYRNAVEGQPVFAQIQLFAPHRPFHKDSLNPVDPKRVEIPPYYPDHKITRKDWALYLETIQEVDHAFGQIMDRLEKDGLLENSIIFFFGDQGRPHLRAKQFLYDPGTNTPLMIRWPDGRRSGQITNQLVSNVDIAPTSLTMAGLDVPNHIQGINFLSNSRDHVFTMRDRMDGTTDRMRAVRTDSFKYIRNYYPHLPYTQFNAYKRTSYPVLTLMRVMNQQGLLSDEQALFMAAQKPAEELYDLLNDPYELNNLADDDENEVSLEKMRQTLDQDLKDYDLANYPEDSLRIEEAYRVMLSNYISRMEMMGMDTTASDEELLRYWEKYLGLVESLVEH